jgi:hypothetical protein
MHRDDVVLIHSIVILHSKNNRKSTEPQKQKRTSSIEALLTTIRKQSGSVKHCITACSLHQRKPTKASSRESRAILAMYILARVESYHEGYLSNLSQRPIVKCIGLLGNRYEGHKSDETGGRILSLEGGSRIRITDSENTVKSLSP